MIDMPGFKVIIDDKGFIHYLLDPNKVEIDPPGVAIFEGRHHEFERNSYTAMGRFYLGNQSQILSGFGLMTQGDSLLLLKTDQSSKVEMLGTTFTVTLVRNDQGRIGQLVIECDNGDWSYEQSNRNIYNVANHVLNNLSVMYGIPIAYTSFVITYKIFSFFSVIERYHCVKEFSGCPIGPVGDPKLWNIASGNYRKAWLSHTPMERFLNFYMSIEGLLSVIKKELGLNYKDKGRIRHKHFKEPVMKKTFKVNNPERSKFQGKDFHTLLFSKTEGLRELRNSAAHHLQENGEFKLITSLEDYLQYSEAIPYLHEMFVVYSNMLQEINEFKK
jgi:hypothetical protein